MDEYTAFFAYLRERHGLADITPVGKGGMGEVFRAFRPHLQDMVAVKRLSSELIDDDVARARFATEMTTLARIRHQAIVRVHDGGVTDDGDAYFIMDYVEGQDLAKLIRERQRWGRSFTVAETVALLRPIAFALDYLHLKMNPAVVHRDVKPANILVPTSDAFDAKSLLTDFGISLVEDATRHTSLHVVAGTAGYLAPELYPESEDDDRAGEPNAATDNYALTLIALEMLTLRTLRDTMSEEQWRGHYRPFPELSKLGLQEAEPGAAAKLEQVFRTALHPMAGYRYQTALDFINALSRTDEAWHLSAQPNPAPPTNNATTIDNPHQQPFPAPTRSGTGAGPAPNHSAPQPTAVAARPAPARKQSSPAVTVVLGLIAAALAGGVGYFSYLLATQSPWEGPARVVAASFSDALPGLEGGSGPAGTTCTATTPGEGQLAVITCEGDEATYDFIDFGTAEQRDATLDGSERVGWDVKTCAIQSVTVDDDTVAVFPDLAGGRFAVTITGADAVQKRLEVPLC